jgi:hypothetical protein
VGLHDGSCNEILDRFDAALAAEGVRAGAPRRSFTGGVCELAAAREFVRRLPRPALKADAGQAGAPTRPARRATRSRRRQQH